MHLFLDPDTTLTHNLNFRDHIKIFVNKSLKVLGLVKRLSSELEELRSFRSP